MAGVLAAALLMFSFLVLRALRRRVRHAGGVALFAVPLVVAGTLAACGPGNPVGPGGITWAADTAPFKLRFSDDGGVLPSQVNAGAAAGSRMAYRLTNGAYHVLTDVRSSASITNGTSYSVGTTESGRSATVAVTTTPRGLRVALTFQPSSGIAVVFEALSGSTAEHFLGSGMRSPFVDLKGQVISLKTFYTRYDLLTSCSETPLVTPFFISSARYGVYVAGTTPGRFAFPGAVDNYPGTCVSAEPSPAPVSSGKGDRTQISMKGNSLTYEVYSGSPSAVLSRYLEATGKPAMPSPVQFGLVQSRDTIGTGGAGQVLSDADTLINNGVPLTSVRLDNPWETNPSSSTFNRSSACIGTFAFDDRFGDPRALVDSVHRRGLKFVVWDSPVVVPGSALAGCPAAGYPAGSFVSGRARGGNSGQLNIDFTKSDALAEYKRRIGTLLALGVDGIVGDRGDETDFEGTAFAGGSGLTEHNLYAYRFAKANVDQLKAYRGSNYFVEFRAGYAGSQSFLTGFWTADQKSDWDGLKVATRMGLTASVSGFPMIGSDVGGYISTTGTPTAELFIRWAQLGAVSPLMQIHGNGNNATPWNYGPTVLGEFRDATRLHYELFPYHYALAQHASSAGAPIMRPLAFDNPGDGRAWGADLAMTVGRDLYAAPVTAPGGDIKTFVPSGQWVDLFDNRVRQGPGYDTRTDLPVTAFPLALRVGSAIPYNDRSPNLWATPWGTSDLNRTDRVGWLYAPGDTSTTSSNPFGGRLEANRSGSTVTIDVTGAPNQAQVRVLLPSKPTRVQIDGATVGESSTTSITSATEGWVWTTGAQQGISVKLSGGSGRIVIDAARPGVTTLPAS